MMLLGWLPTRRYPKAWVSRHSTKHPAVRHDKRTFLRAAGLNFAQLQILFVSLFAYIFGALYQQGSHVHNLQVLFVDYDGGSVGDAVRDAYAELKGSGFPTLVERPPADFPASSDAEIEQLMRGQVCRQRYWGAVYTVPDASGMIADVVDDPATNVSTSHLLSMVWNEGLYPQISDSAIFQNIQKLAGVAESSHVPGATASALQGTAQSQQYIQSIIANLSNLWSVNIVNIKPTTQGSRLIYNSLVFILIMLQEFFYLGTINGLSTQFRIYSRLFPSHIILIRNLLSIAYTFIGSLCTVGMIWAFRSGWDIGGTEFVASWMTLWLFAHVNFCMLDSLTTVVVPPYQPMILVTWVMCNAACLILPLELSPGFYRWTYAVPSYQAYQILADIWTGGCNPKLHIALPVLFSWEVVGLVGSSIGVYRRCHLALEAEERQEEAFQNKLETAVAARGHHADGESEKAARTPDPDESAIESAARLTPDTTQVPKWDVAGFSNMRRVVTAPETAAQRRTHWSSVNYGPCFPLAFGAAEEQLGPGEQGNRREQDQESRRSHR